jgi:hypothetical protein
MVCSGEGPSAAVEGWSSVLGFVTEFEDMMVVNCGRCGLPIEIAFEGLARKSTLRGTVEGDTLN